MYNHVHHCLPELHTLSNDTDSICVQINDSRQIVRRHIPKFLHPMVAGQPPFHRIDSPPSPCSTFAVQMDQRAVVTVQAVLQKVFQGSEHVDGVMTENLSGFGI